jgi:hypothetical protein
MSDDKQEMFVLFEDFERRRRKQFYHGQNPFKHITEHCLEKHFRLTKNLAENVISTVETFIHPQTHEHIVTSFLILPSETDKSKTQKINNACNVGTKFKSSIFKNAS